MLRELVKFLGYVEPETKQNWVRRDLQNLGLKLVGRKGEYNISIPETKSPLGRINKNGRVILSYDSSDVTSCKKALVIRDFLENTGRDYFIPRDLYGKSINTINEEIDTLKSLISIRDEYL